MSHTNGNGVLSKDAKPAPAGRILEVLRVKPGHQFFARMLSERYCGLFTHWYQKRSHVCRGVDCSSVLHKIDKTWKGYAAVEINSGKKDDRKWYPYVLEITEHLELDFRRRYARGQTWELWAPPKELHGKRPAVEGKLWEVPVSPNLPREFNIIPTIQNLYHVFELDLTAKNPLPDRVIVEVSDDAPPAIFRENEIDPEKVREADERWQQMMEKINRGKNSPATATGQTR